MICGLIKDSDLSQACQVNPESFIKNFNMKCNILIIKIFQGDSGGPLTCKINNKWYASGVVSWVLSGCRYGITVFAQPSAYFEWIKTTIENEEQCI